MEFKYSQFNIVDKIQDKFYSIYNTSSRHHLILNLTKYSNRQSLLKNNNFIGKLSPSLFKQLKNKSFIVPRQTNELEQLGKDDFYARLHKDNGLILTLLPTFQCNFRCSYCFENNHHHKNNQTLDNLTQANLVKFVEKKLATGIKGTIYVKWFGGEPLLAHNIMLNLTHKLKQVSSKFGNKYISSMVTNGYLLDQLTKEDIKKLSIFAIQVTLDGTEKVHNKRRPHFTNRDSFEKIIDNLKYAENIVDNLYIRMNIDRSNAKCIPNLLKYLKENGLLKKCRYDMGYIDTQTGTYSLDPSCTALLSEDDIKYIYTEISQGLNDLSLEYLEVAEYPKKTNFACDAQLKNSYVIDPEGYAYKCLNDATIPNRALFNINSGEQINPQRENQFLNLNPYNISKCKNCVYIPVCHGGCPAKIIDLGETHATCWPQYLIYKEKLVKFAMRKIG